MAVLSREIRAIQNPALGATLLASAARGYANASGVNSGMPLPLAFLVLPMLMHEGTSRLIHGTLKKSGLRYFADKFGQSKNAQTDLLLSIQRRAVSMRETTFESLDILFRSRLAVLDTKGALFYATPALAGVLAQLRVEEELHDDSEKLGYWFGLLSPYELSTVLKVSF